jgi:hypothetical protein
MQSSGQCDSVEFNALAAEGRAENSEVPKFQRERIRSEGTGLACGADQNESTRTPKIIELELSLKKIACSKKLQKCLGHVPDNFHKLHRAELKEMATRCLTWSRR